MRAALLLGIALIAGGTAAAADTLDVAAAKAAVARTLDADYPRLDALYKDLHAHPELGMMETRTAAALAKEMRAAGFEVTEGVGKTGLVAMYKNGPGPLVMVRTDLDALPMEEKTGLAYASKAKQVWNGKETLVMHACGHDIHMASWVGAARALVALKDRWKGTLMFIGQPAEESAGGPEDMIADKLFERFGKPDMGFALHVGPDPAGQVSYKPGVLTSNSDSIAIQFIGRGGHGSMPSAAIDPVVMAARFVLDVQTVVSREKPAGEFGVITIGAIEGGSAGNIIPDRVTLRGTIRSYSPDVRKLLGQGVHRTAAAVAMMAGAPEPEVRIITGGTAVVNDAGLAERTGAVFRTAFGDDAIRNEEPGSASEDYSVFILAGIPSMYFGIGGTDPATFKEAKAKGVDVPFNHSPQFAPVPGPTIRTGVTAMTLAVMNVMPK
ncbi:MAG: amidohydrolase [Rhodospirillaceae bacterium]